MHLVTGSTGLLGTHLLAELLRNGHHPVKALYRSEAKKQYSIDLISFCYPGLENEMQSIEWINCDILDIDALYDAMQGCRVVWHTAGFVSFSNRDSKTLMEVNVQGTKNVVNCALELNVSRFIHVSSTAAISRKKGATEIDENNAWNREISGSWYARTKFMAEREVWRASEEGMEIIIVNPSVIIGPGDWHQSSLEIFKRVNRGLSFYPAGADAFTDVRDICRAMCLLHQKNITGQRFLIAGNNIPFKVLLDKIAISLNKKPPTFAVKRWMISIAWRFDAALSFITGRSQKLNKHTARAAMRISKYDGTAIQKATGLEYTATDDAISFANLWFMHRYPVNSGR